MTTSTLAKQLRESQYVVVFTGAGASAESGIPTFRDALTGLAPVFVQVQMPRLAPGQFSVYSALVGSRCRC